MNFEQLSELPHRGRGGDWKAIPVFIFPQTESRSWAQKQTWTGSAALVPGSESGEKNKKPVTEQVSQFYFIFFYCLGDKTRKCFCQEKKKKNNHLEIKLCVSLSAHFTHGRSAERNFRMFAFVVDDRVLGLFFVRNRSSELSVIMSLG